MMLLTAIFLISVSQSRNTLESKWVTASGRYFAMDATPEEGKKHALDNARAEAIKLAVGVNLHKELFRNTGELMKGNETEVYFDTFSKLSRSTAAGRILKEEVQCAVSIENELPLYTVTLRALVAKEKGSPDPAFKVELSLRNPVLIDRGDLSKNDEMQFKMTVTQHCYLYIFNLLSNDSVQLILPNTILRNNLFSPEKKSRTLSGTSGQWDCILQVLYPRDCQGQQKRFM